MLGGCHPEVGTDPAAIESVPVTDLDREPEPGQRRDAPQTSEPVNHGRELTVSGHSCDRGVKTVPAVDHRGHRVIGGIERVLQPRLVETLPAQPLVMGRGPRLATGVDDSLTQQQLAEPVPGAHQITTGVLTGPHQISCRLLSHRRNRHLHNLAELEQPGQVQRVLGVGLHSVPDRSLQLRRRRDQRLHSGSVQMPGQPESRRTCLIRRPPRTRQGLDPRLDLPMIRDQTPPEHLTSDTIDRRSHDGSCVHIQTNTRTLTHTGASHNCRIGRAGSPRSVTHESCERGPGPTTPQQSRAVTTYRLDVWLSYELRRAGFDPDAAWPRPTQPRILPMPISHLLRELPRKDRESLILRLSRSSAIPGVTSSSASILGKNYLKQVDVIMTDWQSGPELLISTKRMDSSYGKNAPNRIEESYGDAKNLRLRHPLAALGFVSGSLSR